MAIKIEVTNQFGVINDYWRIDKANLDFQKKEAKLTLNGYADKTKLPLQTRIITVPLSVDFAEVAYIELKKLDEYKDVEDILE